jgi:hypothetical protein
MCFSRQIKIKVLLKSNQKISIVTTNVMNYIMIPHITFRFRRLKLSILKQNKQQIYNNQ